MQTCEFSKWAARLSLIILFTAPFTARGSDDAAAFSQDLAEIQSTALQQGDLQVGQSPALHRARKNLKAGKKAEALVDLERYLNSQGSRLNRAANLQQTHKNEIILSAAHANPHLFRETFRAEILRLDQLIRRTSELEKRRRDFLAGVLSPIRNSMLDFAVIRAHSDLMALAQDLRTQTPTQLVEFNRQRKFLHLEVAHFIDALLSRYASIEDRSAMLHEWIDQVMKTGKSSIDSARWAKILGHELAEEQLRLYVNRRSASSLALALVITAEVAAMPYTGGASGAAIPETVAAMIAGANFTTQAIVLTNASLGLLDKTYSGGVAGLFDVSTLFEVTALVSIIAPAAGAKLLPQRIVDLCKNPAWVKRLLWAKRGGFATSIAYNYWMYSRSDQLGSDDGVSSQDLKHDARVGVIGTLIDEFKKGHYPSAAGTVAARR